MPTHVPVEATPQNLRSIADELEQGAVALRALADGMVQKNFEKLEVQSNSQQLYLSFTYVNGYVKAAKNAMIEEQRKRGDFGPIPLPKKKSKTGKVRKK